MDRLQTSIQFQEKQKEPEGINQNLDIQSEHHQKEILISQNSHHRKQEIHKSKPLTTPGTQLRNFNSYSQRATKLLDLTNEFLDCQHTVFQYQNGHTYCGQTKNSSRHGLGCYNFSNEERLIGHFIQDKPVGRFNYYLRAINLNIVHQNEQWSCLKPKTILNGNVTCQTTDSLYIGQIKNGFSHGSGKLIARQFTYNGKFKEFQHGSGVTKLDGKIYVGYHAQGYFQGFGSYKFKENTIYKGQWILNKANGLGQFLQKDNLQKGHWLNDRREGYFVTNTDLLNQSGYYCNNEATTVIIKHKILPNFYVGDSLKGEPNGQGIMCNTKLQTISIGSYDKITQIGQGIQLQRNVLQHAKLQVYKGMTINAKRQGIGYLNSQLFNAVAGWLDDKLHGQGTVIHLEGDIYIGSFLNSQRHGYGKLINPDKSYYEGDWYQNLQHGEGKFDNGKVTYIGQWIKGKRSGYGKCRFDDNQVYEGNWLNDQRHGFGIHTNPIGLQWSGYWYQDIFCSGEWNYKSEAIIYKGPFITNNYLKELTNNSQIIQPLDYDLPHQKISQYIKNKYVFDKYVGYVFQQKIIGYGTSQDFSQASIGHFNHAKLNGFGYNVYKSGSKCYLQSGYFSSGYQFIGYQIGKGEVYLGNFKDHQFNGQGTLISPNGDLQIGNFIDGHLDGYAIHQTRNPAQVIKGFYSRHKRQGNAICKVLNYTYNLSQTPKFQIQDSLYVGQYREDFLDGQGSQLVNYINGEAYIRSEFLDRHQQFRKSVQKYKNGEFWDGYFVKDYSSGTGISKTPTNGVYLGTIMQDQPSGSGTLIHPISQQLKQRIIVEDQQKELSILKQKDELISQSPYIASEKITLHKYCNSVEMEGILGFIYCGNFLNGNPNGLGILQMSFQKYAKQYLNITKPRYGIRSYKNGYIYQSLYQKNHPIKYTIINYKHEAYDRHYNRHYDREAILKDIWNKGDIQYGIIYDLDDGQYQGQILDLEPYGEGAYENKSKKQVHKGTWKHGELYTGIMERKVKEMRCITSIQQNFQPVKQIMKCDDGTVRSLQYQIIQPKESMLYEIKSGQFSFENQSGRVYKGYFVNYSNYVKSITWLNGDQYRGQTKNLSFDEQGTLIIKYKYFPGLSDNLIQPESSDDTYIYCGEFQNHECCGQGILTNSFISYSGIWSNNYQLNGIIQLSSGKIIYEGDIYNQLRHGWGKSYNSNGDIYEGNWIQGIFQSGIHTTIDGIYNYRGKFKNDQPHGQGICVWFRKGNQYRRQFIKLLNEGRRLSKLLDSISDQSSYEQQQSSEDQTYRYGYKGGYLNGWFYGIGQLSSKGIIYYGGFVKNLMHGKAIVLFNNKVFIGKRVCAVKQGIEYIQQNDVLQDEISYQDGEPRYMEQ